MHFLGQTGAKLVPGCPSCNLHRLCNWYKEIQYDFELGMYYIRAINFTVRTNNSLQNKDEIVWEKYNKISF